MRATTARHVVGFDWSFPSHAVPAFGAGWAQRNSALVVAYVEARMPAVAGDVGTHPNAPLGHRGRPA